MKKQDNAENEIFGGSLKREIVRSHKALKDFCNLYSIKSEVFKKYERQLYNAKKEGECAFIMRTFREHEL